MGSWLGEQAPTPIVVTPSPKLECNAMRKLSAVAFVFMMITGPPSAIAYTQEDANACTPDAMRICQRAHPERRRLTLCLVQTKGPPTPACATVFNRPRAASAARERPV